MEGKKTDPQELLGYYLNLVEEFPIFSIEDPFYESDWRSFQMIQEKIGDKVLIIGDDLLCTNVKRIKMAQKKKA